MTTQCCDDRLNPPWLEIFRTWYGPVNKAFASLNADGQHALADDLIALIARFNRSGSDSVVMPSEYLEVVITKRQLDRGTGMLQRVAQA